MKEAEIFVDRQLGRPVVCHEARKFGERRWNAACVCRHNGKISSASELWSSLLDQLVSGLVARVAGGIHKTIRVTA